MEKEENYTAAMPASFTDLDYSSLDHHHHQQQQQQLFMKSRIDETATAEDTSNNGMVDYMLNMNPQQQQQQQQNISSAGFCSSNSLDRLSFADVMQFADFGPKLALNQTKLSQEEAAIDPVYFLKFPVLNDKLEDHDQPHFINPGGNEDRLYGGVSIENDTRVVVEEDVEEENEENTFRFLGEKLQKNPLLEPKNKRKRPRTNKTTEEVESQRMTHIAVERNRRKQMNEHLRVLRSLMPGSYVQRGDQASIIGGAIEFVRELEQLLQCLESQKRRRLYGDQAPPRQMGDSSSSLAIQQPQPLIFPPPVPLNPNEDQMMKLVDFETGVLREETAENKSCFADVEVKLLGFDAMIKILSKRRPGQLIKTIAALEDLQLSILHTNITTIEQTVLYSFNVKVTSESQFTAEDIATSVQQIFSFIHANSSI